MDSAIPFEPAGDLPLPTVDSTGDDLLRMGVMYSTGQGGAPVRPDLCPHAVQTWPPCGAARRPRRSVASSPPRWTRDSVAEAQRRRARMAVQGRLTSSSGSSPRPAPCHVGRRSRSGTQPPRWNRRPSASRRRGRDDTTPWPPPPGAIVTAATDRMSRLSREDGAQPFGSLRYGKRRAAAHPAPATSQRSSTFVDAGRGEGLQSGLGLACSDGRPRPAVCARWGARG